MANEKRLIDVAPFMKTGWHLVRTGKSNEHLASLSLADVPTIDAVELVHGRWEMIKYPFTKCSVCGLRRDCEYDLGWNYCPNCGADMRERKDNE